jgi:hypothetical protein
LTFEIIKLPEISILQLPGFLGVSHLKVWQGIIELAKIRKNWLSSSVVEKPASDGHRIVLNGENSGTEPE